MLDRDFKPTKNFKKLLSSNVRRPQLDFLNNVPVTSCFVVFFPFFKCPSICREAMAMAMANNL